MSQITQALRMFRFSEKGAEKSSIRVPTPFSWFPELRACQHSPLLCHPRWLPQHNHFMSRSTPRAYSILIRLVDLALLVALCRRLISKARLFTWCSRAVPGYRNRRSRLEIVWLER